MRILYSVCFNVAIHHSINGKTGNRLDAQFFSNVLAVGDNGGQADIKFVGYLFVDKSFGDKYQYFYFPDRQFMLRYFYVNCFICCLYSCLLSILAQLMDVFYQRTFILVDIQFGNTG